MKKLFKVLVLVLLAVCTVNLTACDGNGKDDSFKIGLICLHDESSTYDKNFIDSMYRAIDQLGLSEDQLELVTGIGEDNTCYEKASELANTCDIIFADSFGHEDFMIQAAQENEDVWFCHSTGTKAHTKNLDNLFKTLIVKCMSAIDFLFIYDTNYLRLLKKRAKVVLPSSI